MLSKHQGGLACNVASPLTSNMSSARARDSYSLRVERGMSRQSLLAWVREKMKLLETIASASTIAIYLETCRVLGKQADGH